MRYLLLLLLTFRTLSATISVTENDPSALIEGIVSAITGDLYLLEDEITIAGHEPINIKRSYISGKGSGSWAFFENLQAGYYPPLQALVVNEPNGTPLTYIYKSEGKHHKKHSNGYLFQSLNLKREALGLTNTARGLLSGATNLKNQHLRISENGHRLTLSCADGSTKIYTPAHHQQTFEPGLSAGPFYRYLLQQEFLLNGNRVLYYWDDDNLLRSIRTTDPSTKQTYAEATFHYQGEVKKSKKQNGHHLRYLTKHNFDIETSDGRKLSYRYFTDKSQQEKTIWYLSTIDTSDLPREEIHYYPPQDGRKRLISSLVLPNDRQLYITYYQEGLNPDHPLYGRVKNLQAPVGPNNQIQTTHTFHYDLSARKTDVIDSLGSRTEYQWNEALRPTLITTFDRETLHHRERFVWGREDSPDTTHLLCKILIDENDQPLHATRYFYDPRGNPIQESLYGNLSGQGPPLHLDSDLLPIHDGVEIHTKQFEYDKDRLIKKIEDDLTTTYTYLLDTDLITKELLFHNSQIIKRHLYTYHHFTKILLEEIIDDTPSENPQTLHPFTQRTIKKIHPRQEAPYLGLPHTIEEFCQNPQQTQLLRKTILHHTTAGKIIHKEIFDRQNHPIYNLHYTYDEKHVRHEVAQILVVANNNYKFCFVTLPGGALEVIQEC
jgi:hypothetical protein